MKTTTPKPRNLQSTASPAAWAFVLEHADLIARLARQRHRRDSVRVDEEDFHREVILDVATHFHTYRADDSGASTWIWWRARKCADTSRRHRRPRLDLHWELVVSADTISSGVSPLEERELGMVLPTQAQDWGSPARIVNAARLSEALESATPLQVEAAQSVAEGYSAKDIREHLGCTITARDDRLRTLRKRLNV